MESHLFTVYAKCAPQEQDKFKVGCICNIKSIVVGSVVKACRINSEPHM